MMDHTVCKNGLSISSKQQPAANVYVTTLTAATAGPSALIDPQSESTSIIIKLLVPLHLQSRREQTFFRLRRRVTYIIYGCGSESQSYLLRSRSAVHFVRLR